jgi:DNA-binding IclR family transcriptional regulator
MPPSAKLVFDVRRPMTLKDVISKTGLPTNTVRNGLSKLKEGSVIQ